MKILNTDYFIALLNPLFLIFDLSLIGEDLIVEISHATVCQRNSVNYEFTIKNSKKQKTLRTKMCKFFNSSTGSWWTNEYPVALITFLLSL